MRLLQAILLSFMCLVAAVPAIALDAINVPLDVEALDLTRAADRFVDVGDRIQVSTAPGLDGIVRRIEVRSREEDGVGNWVVFALTNTSNEQIDRLLVAPHFRLANSRIIWPDLGASRLVAISPSQGLAPERLESQEADVFRITLDPGAVVTYVVELRTATLPQLTLWNENAYRDSVNATTLYKGIVLGISGLLALFLTILFIVKRSAMFPAVAGVAWAVLGYLAIEFGFWNQIFDLQPGEEQVSRAIAEVVLSATLVLLVYAYLSLSSVHNAFFRIGLVWAAFFSALIGLAIFEPQIAAGIARMGMGLIGIGGLIVIIPMAFQGHDRAVHLIPSWFVLIAWLLAAWLAVSGHIVNDFVSPALAGGLVLIVLLLGFTVMQHAFAGGTLAEGLVSDSERKVLALSGSGDLIWDWDLTRDRVYSSPATEDILGLKRGSLAGPFQDWISNIHPGERDHFRHVVEMVVENSKGRIDQTLRMRAEDGHFRWFRLRARPVVADEGVFRLIGTMLDVTDMKTTQERLLRDAVHDSLTGLPNRELFLDRVESAIERARQEQIARPTLVVVNIDHFSQHNEAVGTSAADSLLTMVARRIDRLLKPNDTLARFSGDQFGILLLSEQKPAAVARLTEQIRRALKAPVVFGEDEVNLTVSIGVATYDPNSEGAEDSLRDAEIAMAHAKRLGGDRCEAFRPSLREHGRSVAAVEADLRKALDRDELTVFYQPIIRLADRSLAGFEALLRWDHPRHGRMAPAEFVPIAERSGLIIPVGLFVLERAARDLNQWMRDNADAAGLFTSVNISSRQLLRHDLLNDLRAILARADLPGSALKLELTESLVMENPEYASQVLERCRELGIGLSLDDFGTGYSSLSYLQRFPFDTIKIDQSFVKEMVPGEPAVVLGAIVALGHDLDMDIVAEGIEESDVAAELAELGCEYGQGYLFGHPIPAVGVPAFLEAFEQSKAPPEQAEQDDEAIVLPALETLELPDNPASTSALPVPQAAEPSAAVHTDTPVAVEQELQAEPSPVPAETAPQIVEPSTPVLASPSEEAQPSEPPRFEFDDIAESLAAELAKPQADEAPAAIEVAAESSDDPMPSVVDAASVEPDPVDQENAGRDPDIAEALATALARLESVEKPKVAEVAEEAPEEPMPIIIESDHEEADERNASADGAPDAPEPDLGELEDITEPANTKQDGAEPGMSEALVRVLANLEPDEEPEVAEVAAETPKEPMPIVVEPDHEEAGEHDASADDDPDTPEPDLEDPDTTELTSTKQDDAEPGIGEALATALAKQQPVEELQPTQTATEALEAQAPALTELNVEETLAIALRQPDVSDLPSPVLSARQDAKQPQTVLTRPSAIKAPRAYERPSRGPAALTAAKPPTPVDEQRVEQASDISEKGKPKTPSATRPDVSERPFLSPKSSSKATEPSARRSAPELTERVPAPPADDLNASLRKTAHGTPELRPSSEKSANDVEEKSTPGQTHRSFATAFEASLRKQPASEKQKVEKPEPDELADGLKAKDEAPKPATDAAVDSKPNAEATSRPASKTGQKQGSWVKKDRPRSGKTWEPKGDLKSRLKKEAKGPRGWPAMDDPKADSRPDAKTDSLKEMAKPVRARGPVDREVDENDPMLPKTKAEPFVPKKRLPSALDAYRKNKGAQRTPGAAFKPLVRPNGANGAVKDSDLKAKGDSGSAPKDDGDAPKKTSKPQTSRNRVSK